MTATANPAALYMANLSKGSQGMRQCLDTIARILAKAKKSWVSLGVDG